jgi:hypothetical protein
MTTVHRASRVVRLAVLTVDAWMALIVFDIVITTGFKRVHDLIRSRRPNSTRSWATADDVIWAVDEACVWYLKPAACLQRSVVATWMLRRHGLAAELVIGCRPIPFESHAWVELDGRVLNDLQQYRNVFTVLDRI